MGGRTKVLSDFAIGAASVVVGTKTLALSAFSGEVTSDRSAGLVGGYQFDGATVISTRRMRVMGWVAGVCVNAMSIVKFISYE